MPKKLFYLLGSLLLLCVALYFISQNTSSTVISDQTDFAVKDTARISKMFIADSEGKSILLKKQDGIWYLNEEATKRARTDAVEYILKVLPTLSLKAPVAQKSVEYMIKRLAVKHRKLEIYLDGEKTPSKTIFIGDPTTDHYGNLALLETKKGGRSKVPYYIQSDGKRGHLMPIFFTDPLEWDYTSIFEYKPDEIQRVAVSYTEKENDSFELTRREKDFFVSNNKKDKEVKTNAFLTNTYLANFEKIFYETEDYQLNALQRDSLMQVEPFAYMVVESATKKDSIALIRKSFRTSTIGFDPDEIDLEYDPDRFYGIYKGRITLCQFYNFDKILATYEDFTKE